MASSKKSKKSDKPLVGLYDVNSMTDNELRQYIEVLKSESDRMKIAFSKHQEDKRGLEVSLKNADDAVLNRIDVGIRKEVDIDKLLSELHHSLKEEDEKQMIFQIEHFGKVARNMLDNCFESENVIQDLEFEKGPLQKQLEERIMEKMSLVLNKRLTSLDLLGKKENELYSSNMEREKFMDKRSDDFNNRYQCKKQEFCEEKQRIISEIFNSSDNSNKNALEEQCEQMYHFFKQIFWKNIQTMSELKNKVSSLEKELNSLNERLHSARLENKKMASSVEDISLSNNDETEPFTNTDVLEDDQLEELSFVNLVLTEKLREARNERDSLKKKFTTTVRRIYEKVDFDSYLTEKALKSVWNDKHEIAS